MRFIHIILPGLLVAATGVGAGDLATASIAGSLLGVSVLWAVVVGGVMKYVLTEGIGRWQMATQLTVLQGVRLHFGRICGVLFFPYLLLWSFFVGAALMSACGVTLNALIPIFDDQKIGKFFFGALASGVGFFMIRLGGFKIFEVMMSTCIGLMFITVVSTAVVLWPSTSDVLTGLFLPRLTADVSQNFSWVIALIGGVGGTVTILCYGYWIREIGRESDTQSHLKQKSQTDDSSESGKEYRLKAQNIIRLCRIDLAVGYSATVVFGLAMVIIGSRIHISGSGADLLVQLANQLEQSIGVWGKWVFLIGAFGAVFSSLLGVWQAVPHLLRETWVLFVKNTMTGTARGIPSVMDASSRLYTYFLVGLSTVPLLGLFVSFKNAQKFYSITGSLFLPLLAVALLYLNSFKVPGVFRSGIIINAALLATLVFFGFLAYQKFV